MPNDAYASLSNPSPSPCFRRDAVSRDVTVSLWQFVGPAYRLLLRGTPLPHFDPPYFESVQIHQEGRLAQDKSEVVHMEGTPMK